MAAARENRQTWANLIRPDQEPAHEGPGNGEKVHPDLDMSSHAPGQEGAKEGWGASLLRPDEKQPAQEQGPGAGEKVHPHLDMSSYGDKAEGHKQGGKSSRLRPAQRRPLSGNPAGGSPGGKGPE